LTNTQVQEETPRLSQHPCDQHAAGDPLEAVGEVGARQIEQVDQREQQEDACVRVPARKKPLCQSARPSRPEMKLSSAQPPYSTVTSESTATIGRMVVASIFSSFDWLIP
jgi:hypothetical protein